MEIYCNKRRRKEKMGKNMEGKTCAVVCVCVRRCMCGRATVT